MVPGRHWHVVFTHMLPCGQRLQTSIEGVVVIAVVVNTTVVVSGVVEFIVDWVTLFVVEDWAIVVMLAVDSTTPVVLSVDWKAVVALGVPSDTVVVLSVDKADVVPFTVSTVVMEVVSTVCGNVVVLALDIIVVVSVWEVMVDAGLVVVLTTVVVVLSDSIVLSLVAVGVVNRSPGVVSMLTPAVKLVSVEAVFPGWEVGSEEVALWSISVGLESLEMVVWSPVAKVT